MPPNDGNTLYSQLRRRLIESGDWEQIRIMLNSKLNESGWTDDIRHRSKERARNMDPLSFQTLLEEIRTHAQTSIPLAVKREATTLIRQNLEKHIV